ncbi:putative quinate permease, partial [Fusarium oxysporum f. sp. albedinis]
TEYEQAIHPVSEAPCKSRADGETSTGQESGKDKKIGSSRLKFRWHTTCLLHSQGFVRPQVHELFLSYWTLASGQLPAEENNLTDKKLAIH